MRDPVSILMRTPVSVLFHNAIAKCLVLSFFVAGLGLLFTAGGCGARQPCRSTYILAQTSPFLDDKLAFEKALETLQRLYPSDSWEPMLYSETKAPDNTHDHYLQRNMVNPNRGTVHFIDRQAGIDRVVGVELSGTQLVCEILRSK